MHSSIKYRITLSIIIILLAPSLRENIKACTCIFWDNTINKVCARSLDFFINDSPAFIKLPRALLRKGCAGKNSLMWKSKYGSLIISILSDRAVAEGMNEKGLCAHVLYLDDSKYEERDNRPGLSTTLWVQYLLDNYATVDQAIAALDTYQIVSTPVLGTYFPCHACLEDATGNSAVIEYIEGQMVVHQGPNIKVVTNEPPYSIQIANLPRYRYFGGDLPLPGDVNPQDRFVRASAFLSTLPEPRNITEAIGYIFGSIRNEQTPFGAIDTSTPTSSEIETWPSRWVSVTDLSNLTYYFNSTSAPNIIWVNFKDLKFSKNQPVEYLNLDRLDLEGNVSNKFRPKCVSC